MPPNTPNPPSNRVTEAMAAIVNGESAGRAPQRTEQRAEQRLTLTDNQTSRLDLPMHRRQEGMDYQWVTQSIWGQPDTRQSVNAAVNHWTPVPMRAAPELVGPAAAAATPEAAIVIDGLMLCQRPMYLTEQRRAQEARAANQQVGDQFARLGMAPDSTLSDGGKRNVNVSRSYDRMVPEDAA